MGLVPNIKIYNLLISGYCKQGKIEEASTLLFEMEKWSILPDGFMFESLIKGHCKICNMEAALTLFHEMERRGIAANLFFYTNLINGLCSKGMIKEASKLVEKLLVDYTLNILED